tara:strand:- start:7076 stop:7519 length:444 start_codon:yes stop_codon:yes gene_type:complete
MESKIEHPLPISTRIEFKSDNSFIQGVIDSCVSNGFNYIYNVIGRAGHYKVREGDVMVVLKNHTQETKDIGDNVHQSTKEMVNHPAHYGGGDNPLEVIKIIDHYNLPFSLANTIKYILRSDKKANKLEDLKKAAWYLQHEITKLENV